MDFKCKMKITSKYLEILIKLNINFTVNRKQNIQYIDY